MDKNSSTHSPWFETATRTRYPTLKRDIRTEVAVVGGGIAGLTTALLLARAGKRVILVEKSQIATGESGVTTAHITEVIDTRFRELVADFGMQAATLARQAGRAAIDRIRGFVEDYDISCEFEYVPGYLYSERLSDLSDLREELFAMQSVGINASWEANCPLPFTTAAGIKVEQQAQFHPGKYYLALAEAFERAGGKIFEKTPVTDFSDGSPCRLLTETGEITAKQIVFATHTPINNRVFLHTKLAAYRTYVLGISSRKQDLPKGLFWDTDNPYHYTRVHQGLLIVGGEDHKTGVSPDESEAFRNLENYVRERYDVDDIPYHWSGQILEPVDGLPYIGRNSLSRNLFVATGFSGNGMTFGTLSGMILSDLILERENAYSSLFDATRMHLRGSVINYLSENKDFPLHLIGDRLKKSEGVEIPNGEGAVLVVDDRKVAAYRSEGGELKLFSPVCPHLGCLVKWNSAEKSWDCPCHGSRFDCQGEVINGPAISGLSRISTKEKAA